VFSAVDFWGIIDEGILPSMKFRTLVNLLLIGVSCLEVAKTSASSMPSPSAAVTFTRISSRWLYQSHLESDSYFRYVSEGLITDEKFEELISNFHHEGAEGIPCEDYIWSIMDRLVAVHDLLAELVGLGNFFLAVQSEAFRVNISLETYFVLLQVQAFSDCDSEFCITWIKLLRHVHYQMVVMHHIELSDAYAARLVQALDILVKKPSGESIESKHSSSSSGSLGSRISLCTCCHSTAILPVTSAALANRSENFKSSSKAKLEFLLTTVQFIGSMKGSTSQDSFVYAVGEAAERSLVEFFQISWGIHELSMISKLPIFDQTHSVLVEAFRFLRFPNKLQDLRTVISTIRSTSAEIREILSEIV